MSLTDHEKELLQYPNILPYAENLDEEALRGFLKDLITEIIEDDYGEIFVALRNLCSNNEWGADELYWRLTEAGLELPGLSPTNYGVFDDDMTRISEVEK